MDLLSYVVSRIMVSGPSIKILNSAVVNLLLLSLANFA